MMNFLKRENKFSAAALLIALFAGVLVGKVILSLYPLFSARPIFMLYFVGAGLLSLVFVIRPKLLLVLIFLTRPLLDNALNQTRIGDGGVGFGALLNLLIILLAVILYFQISAPAIPQPMLKAWVVFLFFMALAVLYSPYMGRAFRLFVNHLTYLAMFVLPFVLISSRRDLQSWFSLFILSFVPPVMAGNINFLQGGRMTSDGGMRIFGTFSHPNVLAFYLVLALAVSTVYLLYFWNTLNKVQKSGLVLLLANIVFLILAAKTRNAWLAAIILFGLYGFLKDRKMLAILFVAGLCSLATPQVQERLEDFIVKPEQRSYQGMNSFDWRVEMWKGSIPMIKKQPWFGYGLTSFKPMTAKFSDVGENGAHNVYLELIFESGIGGLLSFVALLFVPMLWFFKRMRVEADKNISKILCFSGAYVISYIVNCVGDNMLYYLVLNWYVWFFIGLMMVWYQLGDKKVTLRDFKEV